MTQGELERLHVKLVGQLIAYAYEQGYELTWGYSRRSPEENARVGGHPKSAHLRGLAVDLNLFKDGLWMASSKAHRPLGDYWKSLHELCRWGGDFTKGDGTPRPDGNHYSLEYQGIK